MVEVECVANYRDRFGESPVWSVEDQSLYWVDIKEPAIRCFHPGSGTTRSWPMPDEVGSIALRRSGGLIAATRAGFCAVDLPAGTVTALSPLPSDTAGLRYNDGKCDRAGRFFCGTLDDDTFAPVGALYRIGRDHQPVRLDEGFIVVNGIAWSVDDRLMYVADSRREIVYAYDFSIEDGSIANCRPFISTADVPGRVDGATVAADGTYWCAHVRGGQVAQYDPSGRLMRAIALPVKYPLMCTFGGNDMEMLFVTTSSAMVAAEEVRDQPLAGALFAIHD